MVYTTRVVGGIPAYTHPGSRKGYLHIHPGIYHRYTIPPGYIPQGTPYYPGYEGLYTRVIHHPFHCWATLRTSPFLIFLSIMWDPGLLSGVTVHRLLGVDHPFHCWMYPFRSLFRQFHTFWSGIQRLGGPASRVGRVRTVRLVPNGG